MRPPTCPSWWKHNRNSRCPECGWREEEPETTTTDTEGDTDDGI